MKRCKKCGEPKLLGEFYRAAGMRDGHRSECKACFSSQQKAWYAANRATAIANVKRWQQENAEHVRAYRREYRKRRKAEDRDAHLRPTFGFSTAEYEAMLSVQCGGCAICGRPPGKTALHVDHDHGSGEIRGLLCVSCNNALGQFKDDEALLMRAMRYVQRDLLTLATEHELRALAIGRAEELRTTSV